MTIISSRMLEKAALLPIKLNELKIFLKVDNNYEDDLLNGLIKSVTEQFEAYTGQALLKQKWVFEFEVKDFEICRVPIKPIIGIEKIVGKSIYNDIEVPITKYTLLNKEVMLINTAYNFNYIEVSCFIGLFSKYEEIYESIKEKMMNHIAYIYENRGDLKTYPLRTYDSYRVYRI